MFRTLPVSRLQVHLGIKGSLINLVAQRSVDSSGASLRHAMKGFRSDHKLALVF